MKNRHTVRDTEVFSLYSADVEDTYEISVAFPKGYFESEKSYPVIYLTDANIFFELFTATARLLQYGQEIPEVIIVAIGYREPLDHLSIRNRDLGPTPYNLPDIAGHSNLFLSFITKVLMPYIENNYRTDTNNKTLAGDSLGGLFGMYTLFHQPESFHQYIIGSPSLYWDDCVIFDYETNYYHKSKDLEAKVFMSAGALEAIYEPEFAQMVGNVEKMYDKLISRNYKNLLVKKHLFEKETHLSVIPATFSRGLRYVFGNTDV